MVKPTEKEVGFLYVTFAVPKCCIAKLTIFMNMGFNQQSLIFVVCFSAAKFGVKQSALTKG